MFHCDVRTLHVGIIMDGNGRWASARGLSRIAGHTQGARRVSEIVKVCPDLGITHLTLFAFSTENWQRPLAEVEGLMRIFRQYIRNKMDSLRRHNVRVRFIGMRHRLPDHLQALMRELEDLTGSCGGLSLTIAIDYGGRNEISRAIRGISSRISKGEICLSDIDEAMISRSLDTAHLPEPDLIVRTSGEQRVSNFLLWQSAYSEYVFSEVTWPDFGVEDLRATVAEFQTRQRRYGAVAPYSLQRAPGTATG